MASSRLLSARKCFNSSRLWGRRKTLPACRYSILNMPQPGCQVLTGKFLSILLKQSISREGSTEKPNVPVLYVTGCCHPEMMSKDHASKEICKSIILNSNILHSKIGNAYTVDGVTHQRTIFLSLSAAEIGGL